MIAFFLLLFLIVPVGQVIFVAFQDPNTGSFTLINFADFFGNSLFVESFFNSFYVASMSVIVASIIAMPLPILRPGLILVALCYPNPRNYSVDYAAVCGCSGYAVTFWRKRLDQSLTRRTSRIHDSIYGRSKQGYIGRERSLLPLYFD